jgi:hypothetical protein
MSDPAPASWRTWRKAGWIALKSPLLEAGAALTPNGSLYCDPYERPFVLTSTIHSLHYNVDIT